MLRQLAQTYDAAAQRVYGDAAARGRPRAGRGRCASATCRRDLRNHVMGKMMWQAIAASRPRALRAPLLFDVDASATSGRERFAALADRFEVVADARRRDAARRIAADDLDILVDLSTHTQGAKPGILALQAGARADHARRERRHRRPVGDRLQADRSLRRRPGEPGDSRSRRCCRWTAASIRTGTSRRPRAHPFRRGPRSASPADAVVIGAFVNPLKLSRRCLRAVARGARAHSAREARVLAGESGVPATLRAARRGGGHRRRSPAVPAAGARRRREPGALRRSSTSCSTRCRSAASTARSRRSTWACRS